MIMGRFKNGSHASLWAFTAKAVLPAIILFVSPAVMASPDQVFSGPYAGQDANGQSEVFRLGDDGALCHRWRKTFNGAWADWSSLGGSLLPGIAIVNDTNGEMEIFGVDRTNRH